MNFLLEFEQEEDGRYLAEIPALPGVMAYGQSREEAARQVKALALRVIADKLENGEIIPGLDIISFAGGVCEQVAVG